MLTRAVLLKMDTLFYRKLTNLAPLPPSLRHIIPSFVFDFRVGNEQELLKVGDLIKIELGCHVDFYSAVVAHTVKVGACFFFLFAVKTLLPLPASFLAGHSL